MPDTGSLGESALPPITHPRAASEGARPFQCQSKAYRKPFSATCRSSASVKPNCSAASRYSPASEQPNIPGASELNTIGTPASNRRRTGLGGEMLGGAIYQPA